MTIARILTTSMLRDPDAIAIVDGKTRLTYHEWHIEVQKLAGGLAALGLKPGEHLVAALSNRIETATLYWACQLLGAIFTPFNWRASGAEIAFVIEDAEAAVVVYEARSANSVLTALTMTHFPMDRVIRVDSKSKGLPYSDLLVSSPFNEASPVEDKDICLMLYTSGTTGRPKGVPRSYAAERNASLCLLYTSPSPRDATLSRMPSSA